MAALVTPAGCPTVSELVVQGRDSAAVLEALLRGASSPDNAGIRELAGEILRCCDRALAALHAVEGAAVDVSGGRKRKSGPGGADSLTRPRRRMRASGGEKAARVERRRTAEDGFIWRKYGQKEIHNNRHPRLYFRCTYKHDSGCPATRQVQQAEDDPSLYVITYFGDHTCCQGDAAGAVLEAEDVKMQPFVINFGSATASSGSPWLSSPSDTDDVRRSDSGASGSSQAVCSPEEFEVKEAKVESTSEDSHAMDPAAAELSSSADFSCASPAWNSLSGCLDWDHFGDSSFDCEFMDFDAIPLFQ
ncbi:probable WRKY transcription factor 70 [Triticum dicoccoides]|uniref:probable WRKY transcription factor 70 n=1 Tax=Triticum dicoccoides TaxID=85692 RepID=UPI001890A72F|nr:probable WRKY transcription factor 70 [Triticum dicoccoides]